MISLRLVVRGRVQGVGFRDALRRRADELGVTGWVRNRADGSVEALLQGAEATVQTLVRWAQRGPPPARVDAVETGAVDPKMDRPYSAFERWPTA